MIHQGVEMGRPSLLHVYAARTPPKESSLRYAARAYRPCEVKSASEPAFPIRKVEKDRRESRIIPRVAANCLSRNMFPNELSQNCPLDIEKRDASLRGLP